MTERSAPPLGLRRWVIVSLTRVATAAVLLVALHGAVTSRAMPWWVTALTAAVFGLALWRPGISLITVVSLAPWGERLAAVPVRAAEMLLVAFLAGWAIRLRPRAAAREPVMGDWLGPAVGFAMVTVISWARVAYARSLDASWWPALRLLPADYLVTAGRDPETAAAWLILLSVVVYAAAVVLARQDPALPRRLLLAVVFSGLAAAVASVVAVPVTYLMTGDFNEVLRYVVLTRSRGSFHLHDVNAAGSQYILAAVLSLPFAVAAAGPSQGWWRAGYVVLAAALWMSGSRAAWVAGALAVAAWLLLMRHVARGGRLPRLSTGVVAAAAVVVVAALTFSARLGSTSGGSGSATLSLALRAEFLETSLGMWATSPLAGVGVGTYYERSSQFMPQGIRAIYGRENAHNYFMQIAAELGVIGLALFLWWLAVALARAWPDPSEHGNAAVPAAVVCGVAGYLLTCVTGHPFLVIEAAVPFWATLGAGVALATQSPKPRA